MRKKNDSTFSVHFYSGGFYPDVVAAKAVQVQEMWTAQKNW